MSNRWVVWYGRALLLAACGAGWLSAAGTHASAQSYLAIDTDRDVLVLDGNDWIRATRALAVREVTVASASPTCRQEM